MIRLTRLNHAPVLLNSDLIEQIDETPDTVITLASRQIVRVREPVSEVLRRIVDFRRSLLAGSGVCDRGPKWADEERVDACKVDAL